LNVREGYSGLNGNERPGDPSASASDTPLGRLIALRRRSHGLPPYVFGLHQMQFFYLDGESMACVGVCQGLIDEGEG
jgi:hypothetical protein